MKKIKGVNDFVVKFANVNGTGSASANHLFAKAIFRMGIPVSPRNIFPSNIQGLPTWYEVRVSAKGYLGRRGGVDLMVCVNPQSMEKDIQSIEPGGYFVYDNTKPLAQHLKRDDIHYFGVPFTEMCMKEFSPPRLQQLLKNVVYVGTLAALLDIDFPVLKGLLNDQFKGKEKLISSNVHALEMGYQFAMDNFKCPLPIRLERDYNIAPHILEAPHILMNGNTATALGAIYGGATVAAWYPITPSTSVVDAFAKYAKRMRIDPGSGKKNYAIVQAEDELAAMGMVIGAGWNGARAFTATSGPGLSLMSEFLGLAYFAELPAVLIDVQRSGPSTGMPTRSQQSDVLAAAYASHGDTKQVLLFPATPRECFDMTVEAFDLAEKLQTPVIMMSDLDLGMNDWMSPPLEWDDNYQMDRGKVLDKEALDKAEKWGRYKDVDGDGICYRTLPGTHPDKGAFFTRGSSKNESAIYSESGEDYVKNVDRLLRKFETAKTMVPRPKTHPPIEVKKPKTKLKLGALFFGTSASPSYEAVEMLAEEGYPINTMRIRAFPFHESLDEFIDAHDLSFVIEQNRDGQMRQLIMNECEIPRNKLISVLNYSGTPITARTIADQIRQALNTKSADVVQLHPEDA
ncbi:MAG: 2-oxoacid:acceptor oxidoreductase subunit alpha [Roseibium sp.]|uniref:2-oxoacid:acceptor oxidoreductase subunit alpha n=1 Tax=Roseibium sp. TaxID=1936156 RepID=UPI001B15AE43|nr:2-oxoacid:acceptor oxidoreductase subunit alpha [Roseibium sp.]MBO6892681.1 2-oxoacid:acceptor oxidoreductase subunit alpha [Roseibium sp.]MBO6928920.1 2-oxoacid:acceptor oxidoreductase subunit alpha [Roseibium sp.]